MEAQPYQQRTRPPGVLWMMFAGAMISNVLLIALPIVMAVDSQHTYQAIAADQPDLDPAAMDVALYATLTFAFVLHAIAVSLNTWFAIKSLRGRGWARIALSIYLVMASIGGLFSAAAVPDFRWLVMVSNVIHLGMLVILWVPGSVRRYLAARRQIGRRGMSAVAVLALCAVSAPLWLAVPATPAHADPEPHDTADVSQLEKRVDEVVDTQLADSRIPGAIVTVVSGGKTVLAKGYGKADLSSDTTMDAKRTTFHAASEAKLYTAAAVLQLVEADKLDLDANVNDYFEKFSVPDTFPTRPVTVRDLLTFTSGFDYDIYGWSQWDYEDMPSLGEFAERMMPERVREPGEYVAYNNYDYVLAGYLVEVVSGQSYDEYVAEHVFEPLGMDHTTAAQPHPESIDKNLATGYRPDGDSQTETAGHESPVTPAGGDTVTSSPDMAAFMTAQLDNDERLGTDVAKSMQQQQFTTDKRLPGMGFGFEQRRHNGHRMVLKDGDLPGAHHNMALLPEADLGVHVYYNGDGLNGSAFWNGKDLVNRVVDGVLPPSESDEPENIGGDVSQYTGQYEALRTSRHSFARVSTLTAPVTVEATGNGELTTTGLSENPEISEQKWVQVDPGLFAEVDGDEKIAFDEQGKLISSEVPVTAYEPLGGTNSPTLHLVTLGLTVLILLAGLLAFPILALVRRLKGRERHPAGAYIARIVAWTISLGLAMFVAGFAIVSADPNRLMQVPLTGDLVLSIALNSVTVIAALGIAAIIATIGAWARGWWTWKGRVSYTVMTVATLGFTWVAVTYNLIGLPFTLTV